MAKNVKSLSREIWLWSMLSRNGGISFRKISTSEKKKESTDACPSPDIIYRKVPDFSKPQDNKNWVSFGFDEEDRIRDRYRMHFTHFILYSVIIVGSCFLYIYFPDKKRQNWCKREAYILLHEREQLGLDLISPNYIDPSKIVLPPDEELSDEDIII